MEGWTREGKGWTLATGGVDLCGGRGGTSRREGRTHKEVWTHAGKEEG